MEMKREYLSEPIVGIIAPAGYGKTEEIVDAVNSCLDRQLILTHTRAGVTALRDRMKRKQIKNEKFEIDTIASFCMKWCKAYPATSGVQLPDTIREIDYLAIYKSAKKLFSYSWVREVLRQSYSGLFVDEYQDCTESQHAIFMELKDLFPIRIFGDPLQGIFYWVKGDKIVNWNTFPFKIISPLTIPWRWEKSNKELGLILGNLRKKILTALDGNTVTINIANIPGCMTILNSSQWNNGAYIYRIKNYNSVVYLSAFPAKQKAFSQRNGGFFQCDEVKDMSEAETIISDIEVKDNENKALALVESLKDMINGIQAELGSYIRNLSKGKSDFSRINKHKDLGQLIEVVCKENTSQAVLDVIRWFDQNKEFKIYRKELFYRIGKTYEYMVEENTSLHEAVEVLSEQYYFTAKKFAFSRLSSRTVLTKGLEFECVIIDARDKMDVRDFYVAMTRAKKYIYIISDANQLSFNGIQY